MDIYWILEYVKVFGGYIFLMFIWPTVVFRKNLRKKSKIYHFSFCVTVQVVLINTIVLMMGFFHVLDKRIVACFFYGVFLISVCRMIKSSQVLMLLSGNRQDILLKRIKERIQNLWKGIYPRIGEYILLFGVVAFGMIYFSYGAFQVHCYGQTDVMAHHLWVNDLVAGKIFTYGVYPEAMHSFIYCLHVLFNISISSIMTFLQCIHIMVFFLAAYGLLREIFYWRYSPIFVLGIYLTLNINSFACEYSMYRLQVTLPMEFGLYTQFLCALYLLKYLKSAKYINLRKGKLKFCWDENLFLFTASLTASVAIHYYTTIMAFITCVSVALFNIKKIVRFKYFIPLVISVVCGCVIAGTPMVGGLLSGIPFESSINWGLSAINSNKQVQEQADENSEKMRHPLDPTLEDMEIMEQLPEVGQKMLRTAIKIEYFIKEVYAKGYIEMYGEERGRRIFDITIAVIGICLIFGRCTYKQIGKICKDYSPIILASFLAVVVYVSYETPDLGLPVLISSNRFNSSAHMIVLAVMMMPADFIFSMASFFLNKYVLQIISIVFTAGIYAFTNFCGIFHGYLYYSLSRYDSAVTVTNSIIEQFPKDSYTIVSPREEGCQVALYGEHEELPIFIGNCNSDYYTIPTKYVFIYVEKRPIVYRQLYYFNGPSWLGVSGNSQIESTVISRESAQKDFSEYENSNRLLYADGRTTLESKAYKWCRDFSKQHPLVLKTYYEDEDFICYYFRQDSNAPYNLAGVE